MHYFYKNRLEKLDTFLSDNEGNNKIETSNYLFGNAD